MKLKKPLQWSEATLEDCSEVLLSNVDKKFDETEIPIKLCNYMDVYRNNYITNDLDFMEASAKQREIDRFSLFEGDVIITKDSESPDDIAIPALVQENLDGVICGYHLSVIRPRRGVLHGGFLSKLLQLREYRYYFYTLANGVTRFALSADAIKKAKLYYPEYEEQEKLNKVVKEWDDALLIVDRAIELLKIRKKGLMQKLLTGKVRLKNFNSEWQKGPMSMFVSVDPQSLKNNTDQNYEFRYISLSDVNDGVIGDNLVRHRFTSAPSRARKIVKKGDVLFATVRPNLKAFGLVGDNDSDLIASTGFAVLRAKKGKINSNFLYHYIFGDHISRQVNMMVAGSNYPAINTTDVKKLHMHIPELEEQVEIAKILDATDKEIHSYIELFEKLSRERKGLIQQLFTGEKKLKIS